MIEIHLCYWLHLVGNCSSLTIANYYTLLRLLIYQINYGSFNEKEEFFNLFLVIESHVHQKSVTSSS